MPKVSIIIPTYNERENIKPLVQTVLKNVKDSEVIVVDDNSPDETWKVVANIKKKNVTLLRRLNERGLASALLAGIARSKGEIIVWMDSDFSHPPELIPELIKSLGKYDIATASRYAVPPVISLPDRLHLFILGGDTRPLVRLLPSRLGNLFASIFLYHSITDYTTGFVAAKRNVFKKVKFSPKAYGEYCIEFLYKAKRHGFKIREIPYILQPRRFGETKTASTTSGLVRHMLKYLLTVIHLRFGLI